MNTWPNGHRHAITQDQHQDWNNSNYPGTLKICCSCSEPTGNCEEDNTVDDDCDAYCDDCAISAGFIESDNAN